MKARELESFRAVMQCGSLNSSARLLNVSQRALSQALMRTEDALGYKLFDRRNGRLVATAEALQLYPKAERVFTEFASLKASAAELKCGTSGFGRIGASAPASLTLVPKALKAYRDQFPAVRTLSFVVPVDTMIGMLPRGEAVIGIAMDNTPQADIDIETVAAGEVVCLLPKGHRLADHAEVGFVDLRGETVISHRAASYHGQLLRRAAALAHESLEPAVEIDVSIIAAPGKLERQLRATVKRLAGTLRGGGACA